MYAFQGFRKNINFSITDYSLYKCTSSLLTNILYAFISRLLYRRWSRVLFRASAAQSTCRL